MSHLKNQKKNRIQWKCALFLFSTLFFFTGCQRLQEKQWRRSQQLLSEAEWQLHLENSTQGIKKAKKALEYIDRFLQKQSDKAGAWLCKGRIHLILFRLKNLETLKQAPLLPKSLISLAPSENYLDYDLHREEIQNAMQSASRLDLSLTDRIAFHAILATFYRFMPSSLKEAEVQYEKAIEGGLAWLERREKNEQTTTEVKQMQRQIRLLRVSLVEVLFAQEKWQQALYTLSSITQNNDLDIFLSTFRRLENKIAIIEEKLKQYFASPLPTTKEKTIQKIRERKNIRIAQNGKMSEYNPLEIELMKTEQKLTDAKNLLIYHIMAYYHLQEKESLKQARKILKFFYPVIEEEVMEALTDSSIKD